MKNLKKIVFLFTFIIGASLFASSDSLPFAGECFIQQKWFSTTVRSITVPFSADIGESGVGSTKIEFGSHFADYFAVAQIRHGAGFTDQISINFSWNKLADDYSRKGSSGTTLKSIAADQEIHFSQTLNQAMKIDHDLYDIVVHCSGSVR